ncbi:MAG: VOC family protein [Bacteroidales bacterium]|nr:MAG: VOC family protein [Bacteroidales bacterium]
MNEKIISGIQQVGIGVPNVHEAWKWYKEHFGVDIRVFEDSATAEHMRHYTGGEPQRRHAALALNLQGGGGFEIWQYTDRIPQPPKFELQIGDLGIFAAKIKSKDVKTTYEAFKSKNINLLTSILVDPKGHLHFFMKDPYGNIFQIVPSGSWFKNERKLTGAAYGVIIGVSDIENSKEFYGSLLGYDDVIYDETDVFKEFALVPGGDRKIRRMLLRHSKPRLGAFSPIFGSSQIELVQVLDREPKKIYHDRFWGDLGFIHICFDIRGMNLLREECRQKGYKFTVDAGDTFDMGEASGAFSYLEDPDGTLIEFVETHKIPILKKLGLYLNLRNRKPEKSLPRWILKAISFNRAKDI